MQTVNEAKKEAKKIILGLLDKHLIACASILPEVESIYRWNGEIQEEKEEYPEPTDDEQNKGEKF